VRSSTSSSESALASLWPVSWLLALALVALCLGGWELYWRGRGFEPSYNDDVELWALARQKANDLGEDAVALVGSSRMQMDIHQKGFARATGWEPAVQLSVVRGASIPILRDLASDPEFRGVALVEVNPVLFFTRTPRIDRVADDYIDAHRDLTFARRFEQRLRMGVQRSMVTRLPALQPAKVWHALLRGREPAPGYNAVITADRFRYGNYRNFPKLAEANMEAAALVANAQPNLQPPGVRARRMENVERWVAAIRARGGDVIFLRLPSSLHVRKNEEQWFPRGEWWDVFAEETSAPAIHYLDHPSLARFDPPDGEHLGEMDAMRFSRALGKVLVGRAIAPGHMEAR
jgi:hypothetical protein